MRAKYGAVAESGLFDITLASSRLPTRSVSSSMGRTRYHVAFLACSLTHVLRLLLGDQDKIDALLGIIRLVLVAAEDVDSFGSGFAHDALQVRRYQS